MVGRRIRIPKTPFPKPKKIMARGMYELMWGSKPRDYNKRINGGKKRNES